MEVGGNFLKWFFCFFFFFIQLFVSIHAILYYLFNNGKRWEGGVLTSILFNKYLLYYGGNVDVFNTEQFLMGHVQ